ncbi:MAG: hypothetical protein H6649_08200 [Caldilineae bacterium]|nr:hypothetical protein [Caldilineae bacterium]
MNLDTTLERCLQQIEAGESIDGCLARYQDQADALAPMLAAAVQIRSHAEARLSQTQRLQAKATLRQTLAAQPSAAAVQKTARSRWALSLGGARRLVAIAAVAMLLVVVLSVGVVASSEPGNPAYAVRVIAERAPALVNRDSTVRAAVELTVAERRLADLQLHLQRAGRLEPAALRALLAGDAAAARQAASAGRVEQLRVAGRLATHARILHVLADRVEDPRSAQLLNEASRRTMALAMRLRAAPSSQPPGVQLPTNDMPAANRQPSPVSTATATPMATADPTATPTATATATQAATATVSATQPANATPSPAEALAPKPPVEPTQAEGIVPPRPPHPRQTALAQTATARSQTATARAATATARASRTPGPPGPRQTARAQTATARAQRATARAEAATALASRTPGPGPGQTALAQTATPNPDQSTATPTGPGAQATPTDPAASSHPPQPDSWLPRRPD